MNTELFIRRPVMTSVLMLAILVAGILGYSLLAVSDLPNVDFPTIQVSAGLPRRQPGNHGVHRRYAARKAIHHHRRPG